ncbi:MAG: hypothetical protein C0391_01410 [Anaerolinea sp.]|nr:hypothetical protein [Anaerolinea sp.]
MEFTSDQQAILTSPLHIRTWAEGTAGCGKSTAAAARLQQMAAQGIPAQHILILLPQRTLAEPYTRVIDSLSFPPGGRPDILTLNGLAQRTLSLFWPLAATSAGFPQPNRPPVFLTMETAQYYMAHVAGPLLQRGYFAAVSLTPNRLYSQLLDNLNKSALVGFPHTEIATRLSSAWNGASSQLRVFDQAQEAINLFRQFCHQHNLLDFSLQIEVFLRNLWPGLLCRQYLLYRYRHIIADNLEEDTPAAHDLLLDWLPHLDSALLLYDREAGYRKFLGADPTSALRLREICPHQVEFRTPISLPPELSTFTHAFASTLKQPGSDTPGSEPAAPSLSEAEVLQCIRPLATRFYPQMLDAAVQEANRLIREEGLPSGQIAILAPYLSDRLRFGLVERLKRLEIPVRVLRPSRSLQEDAYIRCLLALARLAHPAWQLPVIREDFTAMLSTAIASLDLCRAGLLTEIVYPRKKEQCLPGDFSIVNADMKDRITYVSGGHYTELREWINAYTDQPPLQLEFFFSRLFGELLTRPGFGFYNHPAAGEVTANLMESVRKFRQAVQSTVEVSEIPKEFIRAVESGLVSAQYLRSWGSSADDAVTIAPAFSFLLQNRPVSAQIWLDAGSNAWFERLEQPLTHPYVLSRQWQAGDQWDDTREVEANRQTLYRLAAGLMRRCTGRILMLHCELNEQGFEQQGALIKNAAFAFGRIRRLSQNPVPAAPSTEGSDV